MQLVVDAPNNPIETPTIQWPTPASITYGTPLSSTQLNAVATALSRPTPVVPQSQLQVLSTSTDGTGYLLNGFDGNGNTYSYKQLNNGSVIYQGTTFTLGQPTVPNAITNGAVYTLPAQGNYSNVYLIGAATTTGETSEPFILTYSTGSPVTQTVSMSSWSSSAGYAGETIVASTPYANTQSGGKTSGTYDLYGYQITADPTRTLVSVTLPSTRNVVIMALGFGTNTQAVVPGTYVYTPASGTVLPVGTNPLSVTFTPTNTSAYTTVTGTNSIVVTQATPVLNWPTPAAIPVGTRAERHPARCHRHVPGRDSPRNIYLHTAVRYGALGRYTYAECALYAHQYHRLHHRDGNGTDRGRQHRLQRHQRIGLVPQRRLLLLQSTNSLRHNGVGIYSRSDRNRKRGLQWSDSRKRYARTWVGREFICDPEPDQQLLHSW